MIGATAAGNLLVDLEQLGTLAIAGRPEPVAALQRSITASLLSAPWSTNAVLVVIDQEPEQATGVCRPANPLAWATELAKELNGNSSPSCPYQQRVDGNAGTAPMVVIIGDHPDGAAVTELLGPLTELANSSLAVITSHAVSSEHRIVIDDNNTATLEPLGITLEPIAISPDQLDDLVTVRPDNNHAAAQEESAEFEAQTHEASPGTGHAEPDLPDELAPEGADPERHLSHGPPRPDESAQPTPVEIVDNTEVGHVDDSELNANTESVERPDADYGDSAPEREAATESTPSPETLALIDQVTALRPIEVAILDRKPTITGLETDPPPKLESIIVYLAYHQTVNSDCLRNEFWPNAKGRSAADNAMNRIRNLLGTDAEDEPRLASARNTHNYELNTNDVALDWHRARELIAAARTSNNPADELALLQAALELVAGPIATDAQTATYEWLVRDPVIYTTIETVLVDAAHRCADLALEVGDCERATWAANKGLTVVAGQEALYRLRMQAAHDTGDIDGINQAMREATRAARELAGTIQPETQALYDQLTP